MQVTATIHGIRNCDTMKKAFVWLGEHGVDYAFHDYRKEGVTRAKLESWCDAAGCWSYRTTSSSDALAGY